MERYFAEQTDGGETDRVWSVMDAETELVVVRAETFTTSLTEQEAVDLAASMNEEAV